VLMVCGGGNKARRFLEVVVYIEGARKGIIWLPVGHNWRSWCRFAGELRQMLTLHVGKSGSLVFEIPSVAGNLTKVDLRAASGHLFVEVLRLASCFKAKSVGVFASSRLVHCVGLF
jgi:hypothetical protein